MVYSRWCPKITWLFGLGMILESCRSKLRGYSRGYHKISWAFGPWIILESGVSWSIHILCMVASSQGVPNYQFGIGWHLNWYLVPRKLGVKSRWYPKYSLVIILDWGELRSILWSSGNFYLQFMGTGSGCSIMPKSFHKVNQWFGSSWRIFYVFVFPQIVEVGRTIADHMLT